MPRGKRKPALQRIDEQMSKVDSALEVHKAKISELQAQKKELLSQKKKYQMENLYSKIQDSGKSVDEVLKLVKA